MIVDDPGIDPDEPVPSRGGLGNVVLGMLIMGTILAAVICIGGFVVGWW